MTLRQKYKIEKSYNEKRKSIDTNFMRKRLE